MIGIDYLKAEIALRERYSMTRAAVLEQLRAQNGERHCVILSTCNRTELWISGEGDPFQMLCQMKRIQGESDRPYFVSRQGEDAVQHLFALACGIKSQVFGEDQIITQIGDALALAREAGSTDAVLETLFRSAVTAAKEVKTSAQLISGRHSVAQSAVNFLKNRLGSLAGRNCLVIGNGEMGRLTAHALIQAGAQVRMTLRSYKHGAALIPDGVETVSYEERLTLVPQADIVVSATTSPHYTLKAEQMPVFQKSILFCDLAVPRDIDPKIASLDNAALFDTDAICGGDAYINEKELKRVNLFLQQRQEEFYRWYGFRELVPKVAEISSLAAQDLMGRVEKNIQKLDVEEQARNILEKRLQEAAQKTVARLLFGLRETLPPKLWESCLDGLEKAAQEVR